MEAEVFRSRGETVRAPEGDCTSWFQYRRETLPACMRHKETDSPWDSCNTSVRRLAPLTEAMLNLTVVAPHHASLYRHAVQFSCITRCLNDIGFVWCYRYMSTLYSHPDFPAKGPKEINGELMKSVSHNPLKLLTPQKVKRYIEALWKKKNSGQPVTFTDIFGMLIGETLIQNVSLFFLSLCNSLGDNGRNRKQNHK